MEALVSGGYRARSVSSRVKSFFNVHRNIRHYEQKNIQTDSKSGQFLLTFKSLNELRYTNYCLLRWFKWDNNFLNAHYRQCAHRIFTNQDKWSEVKWSEVTWVTLKFWVTIVLCTFGWLHTESNWLYCDSFIWCMCGFVMCECVCVCVCVWVL